MIVAEIQQSSDTTFRLFDWNRTDVDGKARPLHIDQALEVMNFERGPVLPEIPRRLSATDCVRLVDCDKFVLNRWSADKSTVWEMNSNDRFRILCMIAGNAELLTHNLFAESLNRGDSLLIPAALGRFAVKPTPGTILLESFLP